MADRLSSQPVYLPKRCSFFFQVRRSRHTETPKQYKTVGDLLHSADDAQRSHEQMATFAKSSPKTHYHDRSMLGGRVFSAATRRGRKFCSQQSCAACLYPPAYAPDGIRCELRNTEQPSVLFNIYHLQKAPSAAGSRIHFGAILPPNTSTDGLVDHGTTIHRFEKKMLT